jgi:hypothetical protein
VPFATIVIGLLLVGLGLDGYLDILGLVRPDNLQAPTSLIPAYFGAALILCGIVATKDKLLKHAMHFAAMIGLIGLLAGTGMGLPKLAKLMDGTDAKAAATRQQLWLAGICLVFVLLCVNSFIQARKRRAAAI